jgi:hypothetical protein
VPAKICLRSDEAPHGVKVVQILPYKEGGFAVLTPYHTAGRGYLMKHPVDYATREMQIARADLVTEYSAEDRVKLSIHPDGFVQFSGQDQGKIESGRDPETGEPKGLAIFTRHPPISEPIETGPTFGVACWG